MTPGERALQSGVGPTRGTKERGFDNHMKSCERVGLIRCLLDQPLQMPKYTAAYEVGVRHHASAEIMLYLADVESIPCCFP